MRKTNTLIQYIICCIGIFFRLTCISRMEQQQNGNDTNFDSIDDYSLHSNFSFGGNATQKVFNIDAIYGIEKRFFENSPMLSYSDTSNEICGNTKGKLRSKITKKMKAEGKEISLNDSSSAGDPELTPEDILKRTEKQERNKEAARKSRQKKKDNEQKLKEDNINLTAQNQELRRDVKNLMDYESFASNYFRHHVCTTKNAVYQQDHGDEASVETGAGRVFCQDEIIDLEKEMIEMILDNPCLNPVKLKSVPELEEYLQNGHSEVVTAGSKYDNSSSDNYVGYNIGVQENVSPTTLSGIKGDGSEECYPVQMVSFSVKPPFKNKSAYVNPWATDANGQGEQSEAMEAVFGTYSSGKSMMPPPEKKPRLE